MSDFDAIVVGSGCAGSVAAYEIAKAGKDVLVVERGSFAGAKNMTGGRLYTHALGDVFPNFEEKAPLERKISHERISMMSSDANFTVDFTSEQLREQGKDSFSVLRAPFDQWLAGEAENAGAEYIYGIAVESLVVESGRVVGVKAGEDEISADLVILCDGVNSLLAEQAVGFKPPAPEAIAVGIKQVIELSASVIDDRLLVPEGEGASWLFAGDATHGHSGGGFVYTNKESISLGLVVTISDLIRSKTPIYQMLEDFKNHPAVAPLIRGGRVIEHSGHMVPEGGYKAMPNLTGDGVLLAGEAAFMCVNLGYSVRGMDYAMAAGMHAGRSAVMALDNQNTSKSGLQLYLDALENSFIIKDLRQFKEFPHFMETTTRLFNEYPILVRDIMNEMFVVDGSPSSPFMKSVLPLIKKVGVTKVLKDVRRGMKAL